MPLKIVRNDITRMNTEAIVNTANESAVVGDGCDRAVYQAAGYEELLQYRREKIGSVKEGKAFITPGFHLKARYIIHAVSPFYRNGKRGEEEKLRSCYRESLKLAQEYQIRSIAFPLIATGSFGYPKEEGMRIAVDEINAFLLKQEMEIFLVVFDAKATDLGRKMVPDLERYIDHHYVESAREQEYLGSRRGLEQGNLPFGISSTEQEEDLDYRFTSSVSSAPKYSKLPEETEIGSLPDLEPDEKCMSQIRMESCASEKFESSVEFNPDFEEELKRRLKERMNHLTDTFSEYLMYLIRQKKMKNADVYKRAIVNKKIFSKIKNNPDYHPNKMTAMCLCVGAELNLDETKDLLARAGYALSPCDKTDIIFEYFIEKEIYDMIELDIQLEEHGLPCLIE